MKEGHTSAIYVEGIQKCTFYKILHKTVEKILLNALSVSMPPIEMILLKCIYTVVRNPTNAASVTLPQG